MNEPCERLGTLRVMKFGGTSIGDTESMSRSVEIIAAARTEHPTVAVVSAMSGVTNTLIEATQRAAAGDARVGAEIADFLQCKHSRVAHTLITDESRRRELQTEVKMLAAAASRVCDRIADERLLRPQLCDSIHGIGERLAALQQPGAATQLGSLFAAGGKLRSRPKAGATV